MTARKTTKPAAKKAAPAKRPAARKSVPVETKVAQVVNRYDAAGMGRRMRGFMPPSSGPNVAMQGLQNIRNRSRDIVRNEWAGVSGARTHTTNLIGTGIVPRVKRSATKALKDKLTAIWTKWIAECDADGVLNFYGLQALAVKSWLVSGEVFVRIRPRRFESGLDVPMQIQLIESDMVPMLDSDFWPGLPQGHRIRSGVELDRIGQRVAYWVYKEHPGDNKGTSVNPNDIVRVAKSRMLHMFEPDRPGALRGVPASASIIARLRSIADFDDAVLERQKITNLFVGFITKAMGNFDPGVDPLTGRPIEGGDTPMVGLEPGLMNELAPGEDVKFANPPEAGTTYSDYMRTQHLGTAAGQAVPYEFMTGDIREISDRTLRIVVQEFRRYCEQRQWLIIIPQLCQPVRNAWVEMGVIAGQISMGEMDAARDVEWAPQGWAYIHPVQDVQAKREEVEAGFRSRSSVISERGDDPEQVDEERAADDEREDELGLAPEPVAAPGQAGQQGQQPGQPPQNRAIDNLTLAVARLETVVNNRPEPQAPQPIVVNNQMPAVTVTNQVPVPSVSVEAPTVNVQNEVPAPVVNVQNEVPAPVVNVAAPEVHVTNEVPPAEVSVNLPDRQITSVIERNREGDIVNVTQTETTLQ